jgi:hypothetical protein
MSIITSKYRSDTARLFVDDVAFNDYYLFISSTANTTATNTEKSKKEFLEKTIFGKKIAPEEVFFMIRNYPWEIDTVYDQYDDAADMSNKKFYTVVYPVNNEAGDYRVYKCLFNNYGAKSTNPPNYSESIPNQIYRMADGYVWKFMYYVSELEFDTYNTRGYIPIIEENAGANNAVIDMSSVSEIFVTNQTENKGYEKVSGSIFEVNNISVVINASIGTLNAIPNYYSGYSFYVTSVFGQSQVYEISTYEYDALTNKATLTIVGGITNDGIITTSSSYSLLPRVEIRGDGTGAIAIAKLSTDGTITGVTVLNEGSGYTNAIAFVPDPFSFNPDTLGSLDERVILRPVLSPMGGHGFNIVDELSCRNVLTYITLTEFDNNTAPITNDFASIGIVKNPSFKNHENNIVFDNRIELALDDHSLSVNEIITQIETNIDSDFYNEVSFRGKVHGISNNFIYVCEYMGAYPNSTSFANTDFSDISLNINLPIRSSQNQILSINTDNDPAYPPEYDISYPGFSISPYVQKTGEVYYMNNFSPITRTEESREQFKILLEF